MKIAVACVGSVAAIQIRGDSADGENPALVFDIGTQFMKVGFAGDDAPKDVFPTCVGYPLHGGRMEGFSNDKKVWVGKETVGPIRGVLDLHYPVEHGIITNFEEMTLILKYAFNELRVESDEQAIILTEAPGAPLENREKLAEILFEEFDVPALYFERQAVLSLYASGRTTGVVLDIGGGVSHAIPVYEGFVLKNAIQRLDLAGRDLDKQMSNILTERGYSLDTPAEMEHVRKIKETLCFAADDFDTELASAAESSEIEKTYELPDGSLVTIGNERFRVPEVLFQPSLIGNHASGVHEMLFASIMLADLDLRAELYSNIILSGGSTTFPNLEKRMAKELTALVPATMTVNVVAPAERKYSVWIGASILANLNNFGDRCISRDEYDQEGPSIVHADRK